MSIVSFARWFVWFVIALGLQVPSDLSFRVCLCEGLLGAGLSFSHECRPVVARSCCDDAEESEQPPRDAGCEREANCRCVLVHVPERSGTAKATSDPTPAFASPGDRICLRRLSDPEVQHTRIDESRARAHDPPWERANLPLRI